MDIEVYREFMALAAHKSFVSAARDLNMSQPSLSRHMNALSNDLGCRLFYDTRPLSLTAAGEVVPVSYTHLRRRSRPRGRAPSP